MSARRSLSGLSGPYGFGCYFGYTHSASGCAAFSPAAMPGYDHRFAACSGGKLTSSQRSVPSGNRGTSHAGRPGWPRPRRLGRIERSPSSAQSRSPPSRRSVCFRDWVATLRNSTRHGQYRRKRGRSAKPRRSRPQRTSGLELGAHCARPPGIWSVRAAGSRCASGGKPMKSYRKELWLRRQGGGRFSTSRAGRGRPEGERRSRGPRARQRHAHHRVRFHQRRREGVARRLRRLARKVAPHEPVSGTAITEPARTMPMPI